MGAGYAYFIEEKYERADEIARRLIEMSKPHGFSMRLYTGFALEAACKARRGEWADAESQFRVALSGLTRAGYGVYKPFIFTELARSQLSRGALEDAAQSMADFDAFERNAAHWLTTDALLCKGELSMLLGQRGPAQGFFEAALALSERQGAVLWQKRAGNALIGFESAPASS